MTSFYISCEEIQNTRTISIKVAGESEESGVSVIQNLVIHQQQASNP